MNPDDPYRPDYAGTSPIAWLQETLELRPGLITSRGLTIAIVEALAELDLRVKALEEKASGQDGSTVPSS